MTQTLTPETMAIVRRMQQNELDESIIYKNIASFAKGKENRRTLLRLAREEMAHCRIWQNYTGEDLKPSKGKILLYTFIARVLGFTFAVKLMERGEGNAQIEYERLADEVPRAPRSACRRRSMSRPCLPCWTRSGCSMWAAWSWA